jgi:glycosyltransferase involved in cell wall biosynthesis
MPIERILEKRIGAAVAPHDPLVSVVIPAYNCVEFIRETLDSALAQTFKDYEIILVDDGSTDDLEKVLEDYFTKLIYIRQSHSGTGAARNAAIMTARGRYVAFLDSDDVWFPDYLEQQTKALAEKQCDMIYANALLFGSTSRENETFMMRCPSVGEVSAESLLSFDCNVITSGTLIDREKAIEAGLFNEDRALIGIEDFDLWFRLAKRGALIEYQKNILLKYRVRPTSLSGNGIERSARTILILNLLRENHRLSPAETEKLDRSLQLTRAKLEFERGKFNLVQGNFSLARQNFRDANKHLRKFKYFVLNLLLRFYPQLALRLFKRIYPTEVAFLSFNPAEDEKEAFYGDADGYPLRKNGIGKTS